MERGVCLLPFFWPQAERRSRQQANRSCNRGDIVLQDGLFLDLTQNVLARAFPNELRQFAFVILKRRCRAINNVSS